MLFKILLKKDLIIFSLSSFWNKSTVLQMIVVSSHEWGERSILYVLKLNLKEKRFTYIKSYILIWGYC